MTLVSFYIKGFLIYFKGIESDLWHEMGSELSNTRSTFGFYSNTCAISTWWKFRHAFSRTFALNTERYRKCLRNVILYFKLVWIYSSSHQQKWMCLINTSQKIIIINKQIKILTNTKDKDKLCTKYKNFTQFPSEEIPRKCSLRRHLGESRKESAVQNV